MLKVTEKDTSIKDSMESFIFSFTYELFSIWCHKKYIKAPVTTWTGCSGFLFSKAGASVPEFPSSFGPRFELAIREICA